MEDKFLIEEFVSDLKIKEKIKDNLLNVIDNLEFVWSVYFLLTSTLAIQKTKDKLYETVFDYHKSKASFESKLEINRYFFEKKYYEIKANQTLIIDSFYSLKENILSLLKEEKVKEININFELLSPKVFSFLSIYSDSLIFLIENSICILKSIFKKNLKIYEMMLDFNRNIDIMKIVFPSCFIGKQSFYENFTKMIQKEQKLFDEIIFVSKELVKIKPIDLIFWLKKTFNYLKLS